MTGNAEELIAFIDANDSDGFLSDIFSAISDGQLELIYGHEKDYWLHHSKKEAEVFANLFALESISDNQFLAFLRENLPDILSAYEKLTEKF